MSQQALATSDTTLKDFRPYVELLQWLARGSLKQNLLRAVRLWVWLQSLYGAEAGELNLGDRFTYANWRDVFFSATHSKGEAVPKFHDPDCPCARTVAEWLFETPRGVAEAEWRRVAQQHDGIAPKTLDRLLQQRPFAVTRRSLQGDLQMLAELGWLQRQGQAYQRVKEFPPRPVAKSSDPLTLKLGSYALNFLDPNLADVAQTFSQEVGGVQRFFLQVDYVLSKDVLDRVENWQEQLKQLWSQNPVPPVKLVYDSARYQRSVRCIVYPVCVYYVQRAVYLCAFGQTPNRQGEWYNYRLDRIREMKSLSWSNSQVPQRLDQAYRKSALPSPEYIEMEMAKAWGFDFYQPSQPLLLRFQQDFHDFYIQGTFRHETFERVTYTQAKRLIRDQTPNPQQRSQLLEILQARSPQDAYYQARYRERDTNVGMRLRAWRPHAEVLLPWDLRQKITQEVMKEFQLYQEEGILTV